MKAPRLTQILSLLLLLWLPALAQPQAWDVSSPPGPAASVPIDVRRGTWMSLDVSPDGRTIAFDLLGDLYLLDITGGQARSLTSGLAWDMQPRFSPDGSELAFTSDRGGGDNLWVLPLGKPGAKPRPITKEKFRLLNQPVWDPSGPYLLGRKHFTGTRSLGAGEIWSYHTSGDSEGLQLTKRANDQLDLGEPALSPDGAYLYYSLDATPGPTFQYNKDPNAGIYAIERLNRTSGKVERIAGGSGGACTPTPSPDGKTLAFVRRLRGKSVLMVKELESGRETEIFSGLDRDMQETWAIHGVYPRMAWTPDSRELVFWASGRLWRLQASPGQTPREIPFHVQDSRQVREALHFPTDVAPPQIEVKAIRHPQVTGDGSRVIFSALGKLWSKELPRGAVARVTTAEGVHESHPRLVSGDSQLLYVTWDDQQLGTIRLRDLTSGAETVLVERGRFAEAALSPDGTTLVYRKLGANSLFSPLYTSSPGLYLKDLSRPEREATLLERAGRAPHFGSDPDVLYFVRDGESTQLVRKQLSTREERVLFEGKGLTTIQLSPDGKSGLFQENLNLYTFPVTLTGRPVELGSGAKGLPVRKISSSLGAYFPGWTSRSQASWSCGPSLFLQDAKQPLDLSWRVPAWKPGGTVALSGGQVVTMRGDQVISDGTVVIQGDRIVAVGPRDTTPIPAGARVFDTRGKTVLPGLIDVHWHGSFGDNEGLPVSNWVGLSSLSFGTTTLHDPSNDTATVFTARELQRVGQLIAPRIFSTGTILYGAKAPGYFAPVDSAEDALGHLRRLKAWGAHSVKSYNQPRREQRQQILQAARQEKMLVVPEGGSLLQHNLTMVVDGHTGVEHALPVAELYDDVIALWKGTAVGYTPTLGVAYGGLWGENFWYVETDVWEDERLNRFVPREVIDPDARRRVRVPDDEHNHINAARGAAALAQAGVRVNLGAHGQRDGLAAHWELWMLVQGGMTPHEALRCGTLNGARYLGMEADLGSLEEGKLADLIVIDGDPLRNIRDSKKVELTVLGGRVFDSASMRELSPTPGEEPYLWWRQ
jgi:imidazolonepropionase-like amidohydrolase/Tol biopolymer transport system component